MPYGSRPVPGREGRGGGMCKHGRETRVAETLWSITLGVERREYGTEEVVVRRSKKGRGRKEKKERKRKRGRG